jgi:serine/threonine-protein kinase RsbW
LLRSLIVLPRDRLLLVRLPSDVAALYPLRVRMRTFLHRHGLGEESIEDIVLCVQEACENAIRFGRSNGGVLVRLTVDLPVVSVTVRDFGVGMPLYATVDTPSMAESGRGLHIMRTLMDEFEVQVDGGTEVRMIKRVPLSGQEGDTGLALSA